MYDSPEPPKVYWNILSSFILGFKGKASYRNNNGRQMGIFVKAPIQIAHIWNSIFHADTLSFVADPQNTGMKKESLTRRIHYLR